nr:Protein Y55B1AR.2, isoform b [Haemonchus contortus]
MAKKFEFKFDLDEDEETWLTPQLSERTVGTQSKPVDLKEWFAQIPTSDRASLLSKKLQKYAQKRAARKGNERLRSGQSVSLDIVTEENGSPQSISPNTDHQNDMKGAETAVKAPTVITTSNNVDHISQQERNDSGIANNTDHFSSLDSTPSSAHLNSNIITSTPMPSGDASNVPSHLPLSSIQNPAPVGQIPSDSDDEFYDASSDFIDNQPQQLMTSSLHEDQLNGNGMLPDDSGISIVRNSMTQSLMKVEEETPATQLIAHTTANSKPVRASSVSPRPTSTFTAENRPVQPTAHRTAPQPQPAQSRGSTESIDQLLQALISTPTTNNKERDRNSNLPPSHDHVNSLNNRPVSAPRPSPQTGSDIPDLAALQELARQQEEALRQAVERQQHGNIERKHSWQNDANSRSVHSSAGSLVSSKSADMSALHRVNANPVSRIPGPTRLPRKSGIPAPAKRVATPARCASAVPQPTYDDECF